MSGWPPQQHDPRQYQQPGPYGGQWPPPQQQPQYPPPPQYRPPGPPRRQPPRRRSGVGWIIAGSAVAVVVTVIIVSAAVSGGGSPSPSPAASGTTAPAAASASSAPAAATVTYVVTGSSADVTYGPAGSSLSGGVPLRKTAAIPASVPAYYSIDAQLNGGGSVTCEILIAGKVISKSTASGSYNIASCEVTQDPLSGQWQDANSA